MYKDVNPFKGFSVEEMILAYGQFVEDRDKLGARLIQDEFDRATSITLTGFGG